jgi:hypothetical protein
MKTFTTQKAVYTVEPNTTRRVVDFVDGVAVWGDNTQWLIRREGVLVAAAFCETEVNTVIHEVENPHTAPFTSRFD